MSLAYFKSPLGMISITGNDYCITKIQFTDDFILPPTEKMGEEVKKCISELEEYFNKQRQRFTLTLEPEGTAFQKSVWTLLQTIDYGRTISYLDLAKRMGDVNAIRAVGKANSKNPIAIVIPCHRVMGMDGKLVGYAGGLEKKRWLLGHESALSPSGQMSLF